MKKIRRMLAITMALMLVLCYGAFAYAADISVTNPQTGETYTAYKIFTLKKSGTNYDYTLDSSSAAYALLTSALTTQTAADQLPSGVTLTPTTATTQDGNIIYNASVAQDKAAGFAKWLKQHAASLNASKAISGSLSGTEYKINVGDDLGYYFVNTSTGAIANLTTVNDELQIKDKNEGPTIEKTVNDPSVEVGQTVTYSVTGEVPDTTGFSSYTYNVTDTMSQGLTFNNTVSNMKVKIGSKVFIGTAGQGETDATSSPNAPVLTYTQNGFTLQFNMLALQDQKGDDITITYNAIVNEKAVAEVTNNSAVLTYSNDPADPTSTTSQPPEKAEVYTSKIVVDKCREGSTSTKLQHAKFILVKKTVTGTAPNQTTTESYYKYTAGANGAPGTVEWVANKANATVVETDVNGAGTFAGLEDGKYFLRETQAPEGYNLLTSDVEVNIAHTTDAGSGLAVGVSHTEQIANKTGSILPNTGGTGTILLTGIGIMIILAGVAFGRKKTGTSER